MGINFPSQTITETAGILNVTGGTVVQVVEARSTANLACANWSTQNFLFSGTITPTSASNKILVYIFTPFRMDTPVVAWSLGFNWVYNTTQSRQIMSMGWNGTTRMTISSYEKMYLDSPASTAAQTYSVYVGNYPQGATVCYWNNNAGQSASDGYAYLRMTEISA